MPDLLGLFKDIGGVKPYFAFLRCASKSYVAPPNLPCYAAARFGKGGGDGLDSTTVK